MELSIITDNFSGSIYQPEVLMVLTILPIEFEKTFEIRKIKEAGQNAFEDCYLLTKHFHL